MLMKYFFLTVFCLLVTAAVFTRLTAPDMRSDVPVIYWSTDPNPARYEQIDLFHEWLVEQGHTTPDGRPMVELRVDTASGPTDKKIIQGVSGVASDIMDAEPNYFSSIGLIADVTYEAHQLGFDMSATYAALEHMLMVDDRQYGFPCNVGVLAFWVNRDTFERHGMEPPPREWDTERFERIGREFVRNANPPDERQTVFFSNAASGWTGLRLIRVMKRDLGSDRFNETLTRSTLGDGGLAGALERIYRWTYEYRIMPSAADEASFATESGYGGAGFSLFLQGNYAMTMTGRWLLIRLREVANPPRVSVSLFPYDHFPNAVIHTRSAVIYAGSPNRDLATLFLAFLASDKYNESIVRTPDALPPNPRMTRTEEFLRPADFPNEWGAHEVPAEAAETIAIITSLSPYVPAAVVDREINRALQSVMADLLTPEAAAQLAEQRINEEIDRTLRESASLRERYERDSEIQRRIDARRAAGEPVPLEWIRNPFHRRYYAHMGWLEDVEP